MKNVAYPSETSLPPVKLYLDDVEAIITKIQSACTGWRPFFKKIPEEELKKIEDLLDAAFPTIRLFSGDNEFDSLEEIKKHRGNKIKELVISARYPHIYLKILKHKVVLSPVDTSNNEAMGLLYSLKKFLQSKSQPQPFKYLKSSTIYLERPHEIGNFWTRNRDKIILIIIGSLIGSILTIIVQKLFL